MASHGRPFEKGHAKMGGRKKGTPNKKKILRASDVLAERGINPMEKLLDLIPSLEERDQAKMWLEIHSYIEAKPKEVEIEHLESTDDEAVKNATTAELLQLVRNAKEGT